MASVQRPPGHIFEKQSSILPEIEIFQLSLQEYFIGKYEISSEQLSKWLILYLDGNDKTGMGSVK